MTSLVEYRIVPVALSATPPSNVQQVAIPQKCRHFEITNSQDTGADAIVVLENGSPNGVELKEGDSFVLETTTPGEFLQPQNITITNGAATGGACRVIIGVEKS